MEAHLLLFVSSHCSHCPVAESVVEKIAPSYKEFGLSYRKIRIKTEEGKKLSSKYNIMGIPALLFLDNERNEIKRIVGAPSEDNLKSNIEKVLGLKKSFFSRFFG
ncbi:MAG: thioredoxin family protein [Candidatus Aenigmarchaeota archaeon]|nr:thioredoxin family protein [Candidatus Aenigmarchaeota archaeon]